MIKSSHLSTKTSISSVLGDDYTEPANEDEKQLGNGGIADDVDQMYERLEDVEEESMDDQDNDEDDEDEDENFYESDEESNADGSQATFSPFCEKVTRKKELPTPLFAGKKYEKKTRFKLFLFHSIC
jgi:hypothetical protein